MQLQILSDKTSVLIKQILNVGQTNAQRVKERIYSAQNERQNHIVVKTFKFFEVFVVKIAQLQRLKVSLKLQENFTQKFSCVDTKCRHFLKFFKFFHSCFKIFQFSSLFTKK
eukprot:TRINITY_DN2176_c1_g1_i3.p2 TRINITY_DN2176_c1_g1~~TRINITY_DN2176_c1_g1_i3.p2  ORF type:complete len:112 (+),score=2.22 TRINITY_DN2176_c1_g1_i3:234-569(+)